MYVFDTVFHFYFIKTKTGGIKLIKLKLVSAIFYQIFIFAPSPLKTIKNVFYFI